MKLLLSNNQSQKFVDFHAELQSQEEVYTYSSYNDLLFYFEKGKATFISLSNGLRAEEYEAAYITSYQNSLELATAAAITLDYANVRYVDSQLRSSVSMSKLTEYARLAVHDVSIPATYAGTIGALRKGIVSGYVQPVYPVVLKRADADRGVDNFVIDTPDQLFKKFDSSDESGVWVLQTFIENNGFYRLMFYNDELSTIVYRGAHTREDGNTEKRHLNKPKGGVNAQLLAPHDISEELIEESRKACKAMGREFAGVDALSSIEDNRPYILEVNYNPQLVTVNAFKDVRADEFLKAMKNL